MDSPRHLICILEWCDGISCYQDISLTHTLEHHRQVETFPLRREIEAIEITGIRVAKINQIAMIFLGTLARTNLVIDLTLIQVSYITTSYLSIIEALITWMCFLICQILFTILPVTIRLVSPDGIHLIALEQTYISFAYHTGTIIRNQFILTIREIECQLI